MQMTVYKILYVSGYRAPASIDVSVLSICTLSEPISLFSIVWIYVRPYLNYKLPQFKIGCHKEIPKLWFRAYKKPYSLFKYALHLWAGVIQAEITA